MPTEAERLIAKAFLLKAISADIVKSIAEPGGVDLFHVLGWLDQARAVAEGRTEA
jgi:hypothetical protein